MSIETAPAFRITTERSHLIRERGHAAESVPELALDAVLAKLAEALLPRGQFTKEAIAEAVEAAVAIAHRLAGVAVCGGCDHGWGDHVAMRGCFECACTARRPHATELQAAVGGVRP
jgi:hypothetical protein